MNKISLFVHCDYCIFIFCTSYIFLLTCTFDFAGFLKSNYSILFATVHSIVLLCRQISGFSVLLICDCSHQRQMAQSSSHPHPPWISTTPTLAPHPSISTEVLASQISELGANSSSRWACLHSSPATYSYCMCFWKSFMKPCGFAWSRDLLSTPRFSA